MTGFVNEANQFAQDNFIERRNSSPAAGVAYDPDSLLTGAEQAAGLGYRDKREWPSPEAYQDAVAGKLTPDQVAEIAPRRKAIPELKPIHVTLGTPEPAFPYPDEVRAELNLYTTGPERARVTYGDILTDFRGERWKLIGAQPPRHEGSAGRVYVESLTDRAFAREFFPSVFGLKWNYR